ncbi:MAG: 5,6-dimethylbenzimidazole synthase [Austwickia sp.]|jgi:nicotinate-nucleotide--dimethylbenzimidazole phosphoribosyltransferase|nr:MAG: 5,6-dimethylbenzimidazole synthase [Austwickia sp.]
MSSEAPTRWRRPVPLIGDTTSARDRADAPDGWAMGDQVAEHLARVVAARRDIRRYRPDPVPDELLRRVIEAGHLGPSVGHSQPWRFVVVTDPATRDRAAAMADALRLEQAATFAPDRAQRLLDLKLEGLREAPLGIVVACDRRTPAAGVLGRATFPDADLWSCACAIENMWLTARALGLGMGWVTLFRPDELARLLQLPPGVETLGWLCLGWPDERPPEPGLQRAAWSKRLPLDEVILADRWPSEADPVAPANHVKAPDQAHVVAATDGADDLLSPPGSLGVLDRALDRVVAAGAAASTTGTLVLVGADHPVAALGVSAYPVSVTREVLAASVAGVGVGAATATGAGLACVVVDAGVAGPPVPGSSDLRPAPDVWRGDLATTDALPHAEVRRLVAAGRDIGRRAATTGLVILGEVGVGNTTVAAALTCAVLGADPQDAVGLGAGADAAILARKVEVVADGLARLRDAGRLPGGDVPVDAEDLLAGLGGPEFAVLVGVVLGAAEGRAAVVLDGLATSVPALLARSLEPAVHAYLVAGQRSRERAHALVLRELGLEPLLALRLRAGEGVGACLAASLLLQGLRVRRVAARTRREEAPAASSS